MWAGLQKAPTGAKAQEEHVECQTSAIPPLETYPAGLQRASVERQCLRSAVAGCSTFQNQEEEIPECEVDTETTELYSYLKTGELTPS